MNTTESIGKRLTRMSTPHVAFDRQQSLTLARFQRAAWNPASADPEINLNIDDDGEESVDEDDEFAEERDAKRRLDSDERFESYFSSEGQAKARKAIRREAFPWLFELCVRCTSGSADLTPFQVQRAR